MSVQEIIRQLRQGMVENSRLEVKRAKGKLGVSVWDTVSAFANSEGGVIILGIDEDSGFSLTEGFDAKKIHEQLYAGLFSDRATKVSPVPRCTIDYHTVDGVSVVVVEIAALDSMIDEIGPCIVSAKGYGFRRVGDKDVRLTRYEHYSYRERWQYQLVDSRPVDGVKLEDLREDLLAAVFHAAENTTTRIFDGADTVEDKLRRLRVMDRDGKITLGGLLMFGKYPQEFFPQLYIDVTSYGGTTRTIAGQTRYLDRLSCDGPLPLAIADAVKRVLKNLRTERVMNGYLAFDVPEIPEDVLREAITNAVMHRDYSHYVTGQRVAVDIFADRVEVVSPGGFMADRAATEITDGRSNTRNDIIAALLRRTPNTDSGGFLAEAQGSGVPRMVALMYQHGLPQPQFHNEIRSVRVILFRQPPFDEAQLRWLAEQGGQHWDYPTKVAMLMAREGVDVEQLSKRLELKPESMERLLGQLVDQGRVVPVEGGMFVLKDSEREYLSPAEQQVYALLHNEVPHTARELAEATGKSMNSMRYYLRKFLAAGIVVPTAAQQSKTRAYLKADTQRRTQS